MDSHFQINSTPLRHVVALFARVGAKAFGGQLPAYLWHSFVQSGWLTEKDYLEALNWSQTLPGCVGTNLTAYLGWRLKGTWGAVLSTTALVLPGAIGLLLTSSLLATVRQQHLVQGVLSSVAAGAVGLLVGMTWNLSRSVLTNHSQLIVAAVTFVLVGLFRVPVPLAIAVMGLVGWCLDRKGTGGNDERPA